MAALIFLKYVVAVLLFSYHGFVLHHLTSKRFPGHLDSVELPRPERQLLNLYQKPISQDCWLQPVKGDHLLQSPRHFYTSAK